MASAPTVQPTRPTVVTNNHDDDNDDTGAPTAPSTPQESGPAPPLSQMTLPSTEAPGSPVDPSSSFKTEYNDDRTTATVIPSSMTPPPSTQVGTTTGTRKRALYVQPSQQSTLCSPPATVTHPGRERGALGEYALPATQQVLDAPAEELRTMLQTSIAEHQKLKMEAAHHKLQFNLLRMQAEEESMRAAVEHDMVRREIEALRMAEHSRQARRELSSSADSMQSKYLQMKVWYDDAMTENDMLHRRLKVAKKVIQQKEEESMALGEERDMLLNRIRENREHFRTMCAPGGAFHGALTPKPQSIISTPLQQTRGTPRQASRTLQDGETSGSQHGLSALLLAMDHDSHNQASSSQQQHQIQNTSTPSTPVQKRKAGGKATKAKHSRNAQSLSSLPTTPIYRGRGANSELLPSIDLVPQTEPRMRYSGRVFEPTTPPSHGSRSRRQVSRESTISAEDSDEIARRAANSTAASQQPVEAEVYNSQASQAATEMLRRHPGRSFEVASSRESSPDRRVQAKLSNIGRGDKRKFSTGEEASPKKSRGRQGEIGLGIQYQR